MKLIRKKKKKKKKTIPRSEILQQLSSPMTVKGSLDLPFATSFPSYP